ncbi:MAG: YtxH domain-containing protein [Armatimonadetes bacterium]|nr:YtxH domain-containing protein [Armatimonadota bacterium]
MDKERERMSESQGGWGFALGVLVGVIAGAAAATLLAPHSGAETRDRLAVEARRFQNQASEIAEDLKRKVVKPGHQDQAQGLSSEGITVL